MWKTENSIGCYVIKNRVQKAMWIGKSLTPHPPHPIAKYPIRNIPMKKPSLRRDTYPSIPRWICFCKILNDGVTFRDSIGWFVINDGQRTQKCWPKCFKCKFFGSEISWNLSNSILKLHEILIRDTLWHYRTITCRATAGWRRSLLGSGDHQFNRKSSALGNCVLFSNQHNSRFSLLFQYENGYW